MVKKSNKTKKKVTSKNNKGFTLIEIIGVIIIIGVLLVVGGISVTSYIEDSKAKTYKSYKADLKGASENYLIDCMTNNEEGCSIPEHGNDLRISYKELEEKGYTDKLKDPEGDGYCDKSYVIASNKSTDGVDIEYQVCLYCSKYKSEESGCQEIKVDDGVPPTCGETKGESKEWSKENKVITVKCSDEGEGCKKEEYSSSIGKEGEVIKEGIITIEDRAGNKTTCPVEAYVDRKKPTCKIEIEEESKDGWYKTGITAKIVDIEDEGSGVAASGMGTSLVNRNYNGIKTYKVTGGIVTVFGYVKDKVGNEGYCSREVRVDNTIPTATIYMGYEVYPKENSTKSDNVLTINNISKYGSIEGVIIYLNTALDKNITSDVLNGSTSIKKSGGITEGSNKGIIKITKGTYSSLKISLENSTYANMIEKIEVIKNETETSVWTNKDVSVYVEGKDTVTGVATYSYDEGSTETTNNLLRYSENTKGTVIVKDKVGNTSIKYTFNVNKIDKVAPNIPTADTRYDSSTGTLITNSNTWTSKTIWWGNFIANDNSGGSGISHYEYSSSEVNPRNPRTLNNSYTYSTDTNYSMVIRAVDNAGNISEWSRIYYIKVDKTKPTCTLTSSGTKGRNDWYTGDVSISFTTHTDGGSGVYDYGLGSITGSTTASLTTDTSSQTYTGYIQDNAGNTNTCTVTVKRDTSAPTITNCSSDVFWSDDHKEYMKIVYFTISDTNSGYGSVSAKYAHSITACGVEGKFDSFLGNTGNQYYHTFRCAGSNGYSNNILNISELNIKDNAGNEAKYKATVTYSSGACSCSKR